MNIRIKRVYEPPAKNDGYRILVDRLWPRGLSREKAELDEWLKEIAPSEQLRKWYSHDADKWAEFKAQYLLELADKEDLVQAIMEKAGANHVTLVYGTKETERNNAVALKEFIESKAANQ